MYRNKLQDLLLFKDKHFIKVITGVRRCGKSTLLKLYDKELKRDKNNNIIYINFEEYKYQYTTDRELYDMLKRQIKSKNKNYLLLDEIQRINKWELVINSLFAEYETKIDIYITGSNAYLLSSELSTYLSGRYVEIKLLPLSFEEFITFNKLEISNSNFEKYINYGGMPSLLNFYTKKESSLILDGIYSSIVMRDIIEKTQIKDIKTLQNIILYLADNIGNITSLNNIRNVFQDDRKHINTIENYIYALENSFLFYSVGRYDIKGKELLKTLNKYYIVDIGIRNYLLNQNNNRGRILENIIYLELIRRNYKVYIGKINNVEIDFIAIKNEEKTYIQVAESLLNEETRQRELKSLKMIDDNYRKIILTMDETNLTNENGIEIKNIVKWLTDS